MEYNNHTTMTTTGQKDREVEGDSIAQASLTTCEDENYYRSKNRAHELSLSFREFAC
jgi:hypothetical protein